MISWNLHPDVNKQEGVGRMKKICRVDRRINSGAMVSDCQDLLTRILLPLPARTLVRFKIVSRQFHFVISDPLFGVEHVRFHHKNKKLLAPTGLYYYNSFSSSSKISPVSISNPARPMPSLRMLEHMGVILDHRFEILQSCNGLLLCIFNNENSSDFCLPPSRLYCVCNPTTHKFTILPEFPSVETESSSKSKKEEACLPCLTLAFDPFQTHVYKVFGFRVVKKIARQWTCQLLVYSSQEGGEYWREFGCQFSMPVAMKRIRHGVFHDGGKITWITEKGFVHFDVQAEKVIVKKESTYFKWKTIRFFGNSINGSLHIVFQRGHHGVRVFELNTETLKWEFRSNPIPDIKYVQENYSGYWIPRYCREMYQIVAVEDGGKQLILAIPGMVIRHGPNSRDSVVLRQLPEHFSEDFSFGCVTSFQFVETLCSVRP